MNARQRRKLRREMSALLDAEFTMPQALAARHALEWKARRDRRWRAYKVTGCRGRRVERGSRCWTGWAFNARYIGSGPLDLKVVRRNVLAWGDAYPEPF